jgi:hypothetical protein
VSNGYQRTKYRQLLYYKTGYGLLATRLEAEKQTLYVRLSGVSPGMEMAWKVQLLLFLALMTSTGAEGRHDYSLQLMHAVNSLNRLLDYMLEPRAVIGDMIFGVVLARGKYVCGHMTL